MTYEEAKSKIIVQLTQARGTLECLPAKTKQESPLNDLIEAYILAIEALQEIEDLKVLTGLQRKRKYYNKFVKEVWQKEHGKLSYPDFDEIYKRYFEQQAEIERLEKAIDIHKAIAEDWKYEVKRLGKVVGDVNEL